jgi:segregation and condensation protein A
MAEDILHSEGTPEQPQETTRTEAEVKQAAATPDTTTPDAAEPQEPFELQPKPVPPTPPEPKRPSAAKEEASQSPFSVTVGQVYDGPLDLLLDLIRKQNIDIYDIPIARITSQFLDYTHQLKQTDVDSAGEFIYMASLLIHIKSKTLLPRDPSDVLGGDPEDPRRELVERLLEHERFKAAAQMLMQKQQIEEATWTNPGMREFKEAAGAEREIAADTVDLVRVFQDILSRLRERPVLNVDEESVTVAQMIDYVKRRLLMEDKPVSLRRLLHNTHTERALICMFLAMLELVRLQAVLLHQPMQEGDILIKKTDNFDAVFADQAQARDDWR